MRAFRQLLAIAFVVGSLCHEALQGQIPPFQSYVVRDGLPSNNVTALYQDSRGFLWIGTDNGLSRYDGIEFKNFTTTDGLPNLFITEIIERRDRPGTVWVGTIAGGIAKVEEGRLSTIPVGNNSITALHEDAMGTLWYSTQDRVYSIRNESTVVIENIPVGNYDIQNIGDSVLVFLGRTEILFYQLWEKTLRRVSLGLARDEYTSRMLIDTDGIVWMVTSARRLGRVGSTGISFRQLSGEFALSRGLPSQIIDDGRGNLWVTLPRGILRIDKVTGASTMIDASGKPNTLLSGPIMLDREENIWVGTNGDGLLKITDRRVLNISLGQVSSGSFNLTAASDTHGHIWVLTSSGLWEVYRSNSGAWKKHQHYSVPRANGVLIDQDGHLWESDATNGDYHCYEIVSRENSPSTLRKIRSISGDSLGGAVQGFTFAVDSKNTGWFAVHPTELVEMNIRRGKVIRRFSTADGLLDDAPRAVLADRRGNVWSGTWTAGLSVLQPGADTFRTVLEFPGLAGSGVRSLHEDRRGSLWIGTRYGGLVRYQDGKFTGISVKDGLLSNAVWCIAETDELIWCGTDVGLESVNKASGQLLPRKHDLIGQRVFACGAYRNEYVWAVLANTLVIFQEPETPVSRIPPPIYINSFSVSGTVISPGTPHEFPHNRNTCSIGYVGLSFRDERFVRYEYRMLGVDSAWSAPSRQNSVTFASLLPGAYSFEVRAINSDGITSITPAILSFVIAPPVWQRWWFIALAVLAVAVILVVLYRYRVARLLEMERLRTRIAADLHDDVGTNLSSIMLASQIIERELPSLSEERKHLSELRSRAGATQEMLKDIVWLLNPRNDTMSDFILKLKEIARRHLMDIECTFNVSGEQRVDWMSLEFKRNAALFLKEAVNNIAKHAGASVVTIDLVLEERRLSLGIRDNGKGFCMNNTSAPAGGNDIPSPRGNGLINLRARAQQMDGAVEITSAPGAGTTITLVTKLPYTRSAARRRKFIP